MSIGSTELIIALAVMILLFGSTRLPKLARSIGEAKRELEVASRDAEAQVPPAE